MTTSAPTDATLLLHAYVDGELDPAHALEVERQLARDPVLAGERARVETLQRLIRERLPPQSAPQTLTRRIEASIGIPPATRWASPAFHHPSWRALAASVVFAAFLASGSTWFALRPGPTVTVADMVVANHLRALMAPQPTDVASSDQHTVKPWFDGRIPESPRVVDLSQQGFPLVGGRIDVIGRVPVPTLVYRRRQHLISLSSVPSSASAILEAVPRAIAGYNIVSWTDDGLTYWAVSDVAPSDLDSFAKDFRIVGR
jgi:anti-sigma factor RsiW